MSAFLKTAGRWGGVLTIILLVITLLRQLISLVTFLLAAIKIMIVVAFVGLMLLIVLAMLRGRSHRRRDEAEGI
jgi:amino acid permease